MANLLPIKLGCEGEGAVFRRIPTKDLENADNKHDLLKKNAVALFQNNPEASGEKFLVILYYLDEDNDKIRVDSDDDLGAAMEESVILRKTHLKVWAQVTRKPIQVRSPANANTQAEAAPAPQPNQSLLVDSIADILTSAASAANAGVESAVRNAQQTTHQAHKLSQQSVRQVKRTTHEMRKASQQQMRSAARSSQRKLHAAYQAAHRAQRAVRRAPNHAQPKAAPGPRAFIHGRHTCDQCLMSPIVGKRFHATNIDDYDLCAVCHKNYDGTEIRFEEARLDRDVELQERWFHKYARCRRADPALQEALRRSMEDTKKEGSTEASTQTPESEATTIPSAPKLSQSVEPSAPPMETVEAPPTAAPSAPVEEEEEPKHTDLDVPVQEVVHNDDDVFSDCLSDPEDCEEDEDPTEEAEGPTEEASQESEIVVTKDETSDFPARELTEFVDEALNRVGEAIDNLNLELSTSQESPVILDGPAEDWSVVDNDEALARAAQMIGSALFNSEVQEEISDVTTVPSTVPSLAPVQRWETQLNKLHELGFHNDMASVEALEKLSAANIGVGEAPDVSVEQVLEELMKDW